MTSKVWDRPIDTLARVPRYKPRYKPKSNLSDEYFKDDQVLNTSEYPIDAILAYSRLSNASFTSLQRPATLDRHSKCAAEVVKNTSSYIQWQSK